MRIKLLSVVFAAAMVLGLAVPLMGSGSASAAPNGNANANPHASAGKVTICHATGSETNPFVVITVSANSLKAHSQHQDGRDVIPANGECGEPGGEED